MSSVKYHRPWLQSPSCGVCVCFGSTTVIGRGASLIEGVGSGNPFRQSGEVTHALPHRMCVPLLYTWLASDYWQPGALWFLPQPWAVIP